MLFIRTSVRVFVHFSRTLIIFKTLLTTNFSPPYPPVNYQWVDGFVAGDELVKEAEFFKSSGLFAAGYKWMNMDDCIVVGRDPVTHVLIPDPRAFPRGPAAISAELTALGFNMGWYTTRNNVTCASGAPPRITRPGSYGYESLDAQTWASWNITYIKDDSCGNPSSTYPLQRDALNATGKNIFFSMCEPGQGPVTAPVGRSWGNGWRIDEDDGGLWRPILDNINMVAPLWPYAGCDEQHENDGFGCGWNDMGLLMIGGGMTHDQDVSHMAIWCITATKLLISVEARNFTDMTLALALNSELIAIDQDAMKLQGQRVIPETNYSRSAEDALRIRAWKQTNLAGGSWRAAGRSLELLDPSGDVGAVPGTEADDVLMAGGRVEVWQRQLVNGEWALLLFNNGIVGTPTMITCTGICWTRMGWKLDVLVNVRDVIIRTDNGTTSNGFSALVRTNATVLVRLSIA